MHLYSSTSATTTYQNCPRKRYYNYHHLDTGIVPTQGSIPLATGIHVHGAIELILLSIQKHPEIMTIEGKLSHLVDGAIESLLNQYKSEAKEGLSEGTLLGGDVDTQWLNYVIAEQSALIEAMIRIWVVKELPRLLARFTIWSVEQEIAREIAPDIHYMTRCDAILQERDTKDLYLYSLKTIKALDSRAERSYRKDLQTVNDVVGVEWMLRERTAKLLPAIAALQQLEEFDKIRHYLDSKVIERVAGTVFCFLLKGGRVKYDSSDPADWEHEQVEEKNERYITNSPLIRGWRRSKLTMIGDADSGFASEAYEYAHSNKRIEPRNKSGFGKLSSKDGWEKFEVWETEGGVKAWVELLASGSVQPELGDFLSSVVVTPTEYLRYEDELNRRSLHVRSIETMVQIGMEAVEVDLAEGVTTDGAAVDRWFPQNTSHCHYPTPCNYLPLCWGEDWKGSMVSEEVRIDPVGSGWFTNRVAHHEAERLMQIGEGVLA